MAARRRVGVFGGTFDPPHNGHLALAQAARQQLALDEVLWVVTADPPHKRGGYISPVADRLALTQAAIAGQPGMTLSRVELDRPGPHWAADTVRLLSEASPGIDLVYLMGGDSLRDLPNWGRPQELLRYARLGVLGRPGASVDLEALQEKLPSLAGRVTFVSAPRLDISSHEVRQRLRAGQPIAHLVPPKVAELIEARGLYRDESEGETKQPGH
ncbi:MAG: nicotinate-nucleotide adenylyltransferase [Anaerolineales bacterium]